MANKVYPEKFVGRYDGVTPAMLLPAGWIADGKNVRKVSQKGGWKARKGCVLHNTTELKSGSALKSLHYYENPYNGDAHFIAQCNLKLLLESNSSYLPPAQDTNYGTDLGVAVGANPGFSTQVGEYLFYADGSGIPIAYGGDSPRIKGFFVYDASADAYYDYTRKTIDGRTDTHGIVLGAATDKIIIITEQIAEAFVFDLGTNVNSNDVDLQVKAWRSGAWTSVSGLSDGTDSNGCLAQDGTVSWTRSALDEMTAYRGIMGYAYQIGWSGALSGTVHVRSVNATQSAMTLSNKWNGEFNYVTGCRFYDHSATEYQECLGQISNESTSQYIDISSAQTDDFLYIKTPEPASQFGFAIATGYSNTNNAEIDLLEYWDGSDWANVNSNFNDLTKDGGGDSSFNQTGVFSFDGSALSPERRTFQGDIIPGYWYRISWDAALSSDVRIYAVVYGTFPDTLPTYKGCVEFKDRLFLWGDPEFPNRLRYSAKDHPFCFSGIDSGYTDAFGAKDEVLCAIKFYNELIVFKKSSIWMLEGEGPANFGVLKITDKVGLASVKTAQVAEVGFPDMHNDEPLTIAIWQDIDGVYTFDGRKVKKSSYTVDNYFNPEYDTCISATEIRSLQAFTDPNNNEYHLLTSSVELVFNYVSGEWYPPWEREIVLNTGLGFRANDNRQYTFGGSSNGFIMKLETNTTDKDTSNIAKPIDHSIKTRAIGYENDKTGELVIFTLRRIMAELKARTTGSITTKTFKDMATNGVLQYKPSSMSMVREGYGITVPELQMSIENCRTFQVEFSVNVIDQEMEITSFYYEIGGKGIIN